MTTKILLLSKREYKSKAGVALTELAVLAIETKEYYSITVETELFDKIGSPLPDPEIVFEMDTIAGKGPFARPTIQTVKAIGKIEFKVTEGGKK